MGRTLPIQNLAAGTAGAFVRFNVSEFDEVVVEAFADQGDWTTGVLSIQRSVSGGQFFALETAQTLTGKSASLSNAIPVSFPFLRVFVFTANAATMNVQIHVYGRKTT